MRLGKHLFHVSSLKSLPRLVRSRLVDVFLNGIPATCIIAGPIDLCIIGCYIISFAYYAVLLLTVGLLHVVYLYFS